MQDACGRANAYDDAVAYSELLSEHSGLAQLESAWETSALELVRAAVERQQEQQEEQREEALSASSPQTHDRMLFVTPRGGLGEEGAALVAPPLATGRAAPHDPLAAATLSELDLAAARACARVVDGSPTAPFVYLMPPLDDDTEAERLA
eukprot:6556862-Prymnesium_polylepis.1